MKKLLLVLVSLLSLSAFAQDTVVIDSSQVSVGKPEVIIVRTNKTPDNITLNFLVPMANSVCERYGERYVTVTSGVRCGYAERVTGYVNRTVCVRRNPYNNVCVNERVERVPVITRFPRSCPVRETFCASYGTSTRYEADTVKIKFKNAPALGDSEQETFRVSAKQKRFDGEAVVYDIQALETSVDYEIKDRGFLGSDKYVIQPK